MVAQSESPFAPESVGTYPPTYYCKFDIVSDTHSGSGTRPMVQQALKGG